MYLNCKTCYSLRYGTWKTEELVDAAVDHGVAALALTNINSTCDLWDFVLYCNKKGVKPVCGVEIRNGDDFCYLLLARNNEGLQTIHEFLSKHLLEKKPFPEKPFMEPARPDNLLPVVQEKNVFVIYSLDQAVGDLGPMEKIGVLPWEINKLFTTDCRKYRDKYVIRHPVTVQNNTYFNVHRVLRAIDKNTLATKLGKEGVANPCETFVSPAELIARFSQYDFMITNAYRLLEDCTVTMDFEQPKDKKTFSASAQEDKKLLEKLALEGFALRYGTNRIALERLKKELRIIDEMGFNAYFLITWDMIRYAEGCRFSHVGRGSGANSIVAYCLRITDVDPIDLNLFFERFLNPERTSPPDFDIDFSWRDRDRVIDYMFMRYGHRHVALLGMYSTFQYRAVVREIGKVFGLPPREIEALAREYKPRDAMQEKVMKYGNLIKGMPNHLSIHPGGILISEQPIAAYMTVFMPPKGFPTGQIDMFVAESIGLNKLDVLSQRGLGHIKEGVRLVRLNKGVDVDIENIDKIKEDKAVKELIRTAQATGCFYVESPSMRALLNQLQCDDYHTLVAASSIIRPGVSSSGMKNQYIQRYRSRKIEYLHPLFEEHLSETFGVMVFQEDVIKIAHAYAGLTLGQADILRRAMSGKYRSNAQFLLIRDQFFAGADALGRDPKITEEVWRQMESFAGYSFNKAHSASFAVESLQSLYLKAHFPREFMVAVINNHGGFYNSELYFLMLRKDGANIHHPCINNSDLQTNIDDREVYVGLEFIKGLEQTMIERILVDRKRRGPYLGLIDFISRTEIKKEQLNLLITAGALRFTGKSKKTLLWEGNFFQTKNKAPACATKLFDDAPIEFKLPVLQDDPLDEPYDEQESLGLFLGNPFEIVEEDPLEFVLAKDIPKHYKKTVTMILYYVERKVVPTKNGQTMAFVTWLDAELNWVDTTFFQRAYESYPIHKSGFYKVTGKVTEEFGAFNIDVRHVSHVGVKERKYQNL